jgi:hypothetical protein
LLHFLSPLLLHLEDFAQARNVRFGSVTRDFPSRAAHSSNATPTLALRSVTAPNEDNIAAMKAALAARSGGRSRHRAGENAGLRHGFYKGAIVNVRDADEGAF